MTAIGLFGGSFNPAHVAHQLLALYVLETQGVDELWFVPTYAHPFGKQLASYEHRLAMCELAAAPLGARVKVSRAEEELAQRPGFVASRTLDLVEHLRATRARDTWRLVIGTDILGETAKWYRWNDVARLAPPIVIARPGHPGAGGLPMPDVSATHIRALLAQLTQADRARLAAGQVIEGELGSLLPRSVLWYIARHGLYA